MCDHLTALRLFASIKPGWEYCAIDALGLSGGILSAWDPRLVKCKAFLSFAGILLHARFRSLDSVFSIVNCYGPYANRISFWDKVVAGVIFHYPNLILAGDLNFTTSELEIWGEHARRDHLSLYFTQLLDSMNMVDILPSKIGPTWRNGRAGSAGVCKRLDRFRASFTLVPLLGCYKSWIQPSEISDHYPVCLEWSLSLRCHLYPFKFNRAWLLEKDFGDLVHKSWRAPTTSAGPMFDINFKLQRFKNEVKT